MPDETERNDIPSGRKYRLILTVLLLAVAAAVLVSRTLTPDPPAVGDIDDNRFLLDTIVSIRIYESDDREMLDDAFDAIADYESLLSRHHSESEISMINRSGGPQVVSPDTLEVLSAALDYAGLTDGAFDPTVGPLVDLWGIGTDDPGIPSDDELKAVLELVDYREVSTDGDTVSLGRDGMTLDLGGVAKGWIADRIADRLHRDGAEHVLINLGGNVRVSGGKPGGEDFRIGMQDPDDERGAYLGIFSLADGSVVSSGVYERFFEEDGVRYHHILDTVSGYPAENGLSAVTVISDRSVDGDALSTALFVLGLEKGLELAGSLDGVEAAFVTDEGRIVMTAGAAAIFTPGSDNIEVEIYG